MKFAQPAAGDAAERWADLLACEHLALTCLRDAGVPAAASQLIQTDSHTFLEVERFDRTPDVLGRRGFVSLLALSSAFVGEATTTWGVAAEALLAQRWGDRDTATTMAHLHAFGRLIGNSDTHQGNLGFLLVDRGPLPLAPVYGMLPMSLAPSRTCNGRRHWRWTSGSGWPGRGCCALRRCGRWRPRTPAGCRQWGSGLAESGD